MNTAIRNAVPEHRLAASAGDAARSSWSGVETFLAMVVDEIRQLEWMYAQAHSDQPINKPTPIRRPGTGGGARKRRAIPLDVAQRLDPRLRGMSADEAQAFLERMTGAN